MLWPLLATFCCDLAKDLLKAVQSVLGAIVGLIPAISCDAAADLWAGLVAFGGAWIITNFNPPLGPDRPALKVVHDVKLRQWFLLIYTAYTVVSISALLWVAGDDHEI